MEFLTYLLYRTVTLLVGALPLTLVFRLGQFGGWLGYCLLWPYRRLATANLNIAYGGVRTPAEIRRLARQHFATLGANLLASIKAAGFDAARLHEILEVEGMDLIRAAFAERRGVVLAISHIGNWEMFAQACQLLPDEKWGTVYQPLANRHIEAHIQRTRQRVALFNRKSGFNAPTAFLREGGALGVLIDQHAGDGGVWTPFFGRLASTSTLAALLALRTNAVVVPMAVHTTGVGRWRIVISPPLPSADSAEALTARLNRVLESQIDVSPADWFWVHNRWKTPKPRFLLARYKRGIILPEGVSASDLKPFRILVRSANWLGDAVMSIPAVRAIAAGRPDARVTVLAPAKLADLWREVPGVADVLPIPAGARVYKVAAAVRYAGPFDAAVLLPNSLRAALEAWLAGVPRRVGFPGHRRRWLLNQIVSEESALASAKGDPRRHQTHRYARLVEEIGAGDVAMDAPSPSPPGARGERGGWLRVGICPGAEYGPTKRWPAERFAEAARLVAAERACEWTIFGVAKDAPYAAVIEAALGEQRCENLVGKTTLSELVAALRRCDVLLTNDTGTMHLAAYLGVPVAAVFGSTDPLLTAPLVPAERLRILRRQVECSPCFLKECPLDLRCLHAVTAESAAAAVLNLANAQGGKQG